MWHFVHTLVHLAWDASLAPIPISCILRPRTRSSAVQSLAGFTADRAAV